MGERSAIEWTDATWNPWRGCDKVSPGCAHCYMFAGQRRYGRDPSVVVRASVATFDAPMSTGWVRDGARILEREGRPMRVFTCSWSDWFHEAADAWRPMAWEIIRRRPEFDFQILTKRPERILEHLPAGWGDGWPNVWLGVSIENRRFVHRADLLREVPAAVRFISAEPLLGPIAPERMVCSTCSMEGPDDHCDECEGVGDWWLEGGLSLVEIDWLIVGGESGPKHRPIREQWVRDLRDLADDYDVAFFLKQWGGVRPGGEALLDGRKWREFPRSAERGQLSLTAPPSSV